MRCGDLSRPIYSVVLILVSLVLIVALVATGTLAVFFQVGLLCLSAAVWLTALPLHRVRPSLPSHPFDSRAPPVA